jgi:hypothetical protein
VYAQYAFFYALGDISLGLNHLLWQSAKQFFKVLVKFVKSFDRLCKHKDTLSGDQVNLITNSIFDRFRGFRHLLDPYVWDPFFYGFFNNTEGFGFWYYDQQSIDIAGKKRDITVTELPMKDIGIRVDKVEVKSNFFQLLENCIADFF